MSSRKGKGASSSHEKPPPTKKTKPNPKSKKTKGTSSSLAQTCVSSPTEIIPTTGTSNPPTTENVEQYNSSKFSSANAEKEFGTHWSARVVIAERGINLDHFQGPEFQLKQNFEERGWLEFAKFRGPALVPLVQEFYCNIRSFERDGEDCISTRLRGKDLKFTPQSIAELFQLERVANPGFPYPDERRPSRDEIAQALSGRAEEKWGHKTRMEKKKLTKKYNALHFLTCSQFMPLVNTTDVSYERGLLMYAIATGVPIDLPQYIWDGIATAGGNKTSITGLPFGTLITEFAKKEGVKQRSSMKRATPLGMITATSGERSESQLRRVAPPTTEETLARLEDQHEQVRDYVRQIRDDQGILRRNQENLAKKQEELQRGQEALLKGQDEILTLLRAIVGSQVYEPPPSISAHTDDPTLHPSSSPGHDT